MTKTTTILAFSVVLALVIGIVSSGSIVEAAKPVTEAIIVNDSTNPIPVTGIPSNVVCPADKVQHWHTLVMTLRTTIQHDTKPTLIDRISFDILAEDGIVSKGHISQQVVDRLNSLGYYVLDPTKRDVQLSDITSVHVSNIINGSVICAES